MSSNCVSVLVGLVSQGKRVEQGDLPKVPVIVSTLTTEDTIVTVFEYQSRSPEDLSWVLKQHPSVLVVVKGH